MKTSDLMQGFPPKPEAQVTLSNWRQAPFNRWALHNIRQILPTAPIERNGPGVPLPRAVRAVDRIALPGRNLTVADVLARTYTDGFLVLHNGHLAYETYATGMRPVDQHILFSVTKSVTASLAGIYVDRGALDPDALVTRYVPEAKGSAYATATIRHVLDMTVGIAFDEDYTAQTGDFVRYREASGWNPVFDPARLGDNIRAFVTTLPPSGEHGHTYHYVSPNSDLLGWIIERATGTRFHELMSRDLWGPLGAEHDAYIGVDRIGTPRTAGGLCTSLRDLARFGQMMLERGVANGRQIVPSAWVDDIRAGGDAEAWKRGGTWLPGGRYRSKWYSVGNASDAFLGNGIHGQWLYLDPAASVVIAKFSSQPKAVDDAMDEICLLAFDAIARGL
ncbi:MAG: class C beta-lactamase-related serine hydrolase [Alphaproteobacteria bacterium]|nr:class C beta-lactamase-related serine hydrolase [Alphaproteobacteria bacterium]